MKKSLTPFLLFIIAIAVVMLWAPRQAIDPWGLFKPFKVLQLIFFLAVIQILSAFLMRFFNRRFGGIAVGFLGGLVSSTAFTASLARQSHGANENEIRLQSLSYLSALLGMALEAMFLVYIGSGEFHWRLTYIFISPLLMTIFLIVWRTKTLRGVSFSDGSNSSLSVVSLVKLGIFIALILAVSKILQNAVGEYGIYILTFLVSLFELHGSMIANMQLHEAGGLNVTGLGHTVTIGLLASYFAKMTLVLVLGCKELKTRIVRYSILLIGSLLLGWGVFLVAS
ncbi:MAG TPA: DUF4010 domain-containing protein [Bdellovibrio sp.]